MQNKIINQLFNKKSLILNNKTKYKYIYKKIIK